MISIFLTRALLWFDSRYAITKAFCVAFLMTFFSLFDVPVFWPILLCYWVVLFVLTMKRQIMHMIKYKYVPLNIGKQVRACLFEFTNCSFPFTQFQSDSVRGQLPLTVVNVMRATCNPVLVILWQTYTGKKSAGNSPRDWSWI